METSNKPIKYKEPFPVVEEEEDVIPYFVHLKSVASYYFQPENKQQKENFKVKKESK